jgi:hypothetical protein
MFITSPAMTQCYTVDGLLRTYRKDNKWFVEQCFKSETVWYNAYKSEQIWHLIGQFSDVNDAEATVQKILGSPPAQA